MKALDLQQIVVTYFFLLFFSIPIIFVASVTSLAGQFVAFFIAALLVLFGLLFQDHIMSYPLIIAGLVAVVRNILSIIEVYRFPEIYSVSAVSIVIDVIFLFLLIGVSSYFLDAYKKQNKQLLMTAAINATTLLFLLATLGLSSLGLMFSAMFMPIMLFITGCAFGLFFYMASRKPFVIQFGMREFVCSFCLPAVSLIGFNTFEKMVPGGLIREKVLVVAAITIFIAGLVFKKTLCAYGLILSGLLLLYVSLFNIFKVAQGNASAGFIIIFFILILLIPASYVIGAWRRRGLQLVKGFVTAAGVLLFLSIVIACWFAALSFVDMIIKGKTMM